MAFEPRVNTIKQRQNDNGHSENLVHSFWTFAKFDTLTYFVVCIASIRFLPMCIYRD